MRTVMVSTILLAFFAAAHAEPWRRHTIDNSSRGADGVRLADVNGDSLPDIVTGWEEGGVIRVYLNPGARKAKQPWPAVTVGKVKSPEDAVFADLDGDGAVDVVSSCEGGNRTMYIHWAPKDAAKYLDANAWETEPIPATAKKQSWMFCLPLQIDGRGGVDLIVASKGGGATVGCLLSPENPRDTAAWKFHPIYQAGWIMSLRLHDMDDDSDADVLVSDRKGPGRGVLWLENPGAKAATVGEKWNEHRVGAADREVMFLTVADYDGDGAKEILVAVKGPGITVLKNKKGTQDFSLSEIAMPANCGSGKGVGVGDINLDKRPDVVFSCEHARGDKSGVRWLSYRKSPADEVWDDHEISGPTGVKFDRLELLDMDADGDLDVLTCEEAANLGVIWYENPTR